MTLSFKVNGQIVTVASDPLTRLSQILREELGLIGLKEGCREGECGACTILVDDKPVNACLMLGFQAEGHEITTIEGFSEAGMLSDLQNAFLAFGAVQCGYCTPGVVMAAEGLLRANPVPSVDEIRHALAGNICRCTGFEAIVRAIAATAAGRLQVQT